jgi:type II secretory pathway predicted ATPase ExeA
MIETFYQFSQMPFGKDLSGSELFASASFKELQHRLEYMRRRRGLMLLTGPPGCGKTAAVRAFLQQLNPNTYSIFYFPLSTVTPLDFYVLLNCELGGPPSIHKSRLFLSLQKSIRDLAENARKVPFLILDEAQYLRDRTLDELPILLNFKMDSLDPLVFILIAHPPFLNRLQRPPFRNLDQRILMRYQLPPLSESETSQYISHQLTRVGARPEIFSDSARLAIHKNTQGLCRLINHLCLAALHLGALEQKNALNEEDIYRVTSEI